MASRLGQLSNRLPETRHDIQFCHTHIQEGIPVNSR